MPKEARDALTQLLSREDILALIQNPDPVLQAMSNWFSAYQAWERTDIDFKTIWRDHRMLLRSIGAQDSSYATLQAKAPSYDSWKEKGWESTKGDAPQMIEVKGVRYETGRAAILKRTNPEVFLKAKESGKIKAKYAEGLMD